MTEFLNCQQRSRIMSRAQSFIGTPFIHQGRLPGAGLDCGGVVICAAKDEPTIDIQDELAYSRQPWARRFRTHCETTLQQLDGIQKAQDASIILFWVQRKRIEQHVALYLGNAATLAAGTSRIIHSWFHVMRVCDSPFDAYWAERVSAVFDFKELV